MNVCFPKELRRYCAISRLPFRVYARIAFLTGAMGAFRIAMRVASVGFLTMPTKFCVSFSFGVVALNWSLQLLKRCTWGFGWAERMNSSYSGGNWMSKSKFAKIQ